MAYPQYQPYPYQYQPQVPAPMDRLAQLQAQQMLPAQMSGTPQQPPQGNQSLIYVQGEAAAKSWMVSPGQSVLLMDSEQPVFFIKSADASGIPLPLRIFDYKERTQAPAQNALQAPQSVTENLDDKYVTRAEYDGLQAKYMEILDRLNSFHASDMASEDGRKPTTAANKSRNRGGNDHEQSRV